jgi:hypothetical protein
VTNDHVADYAGRILAGFQHDKLPRRLPTSEAWALAERYNVHTGLPHPDDVPDMTLKEIATALAEQLEPRSRKHGIHGQVLAGAPRA